MNLCYTSPIGLDSDYTVRLHLRSGGHCTVSPTPKGESAVEAFFIGRIMNTMDVDKLRQYFLYNPDNGKLEWRITRLKAKQGDVVSAVSGRGYITIQVDGKKFQAHRLIWAIFYGAFPTGDIDHINGIKTDNRIANLRDVQKSINVFNGSTKSNNTTGKTGVFFHKKDNLFVAYIGKNNKKHYLGCFKNFDDAVMARKEAEQKLFPTVKPRFA